MEHVAPTRPGGTVGQRLGVGGFGAVWELARTHERLALKVGVATSPPGMEPFADEAAALEAVHARGLVHCDVKPENTRRAGAREESGRPGVERGAHGVVSGDAHPHVLGPRAARAGPG